MARVDFPVPPFIEAIAMAFISSPLLFLRLVINTEDWHMIPDTNGKAARMGGFITKGTYKLLECGIKNSFGFRFLRHFVVLFIGGRFV
jgi:hypothetical protein